MRRQSSAVTGERERKGKRRSTVRQANGGGCALLLSFPPNAPAMGFSSRIWYPRSANATAGSTCSLSGVEISAQSAKRSCFTTSRQSVNVLSGGNPWLLMTQFQIHSTIDKLSYLVLMDLATHRPFPRTNRFGEWGGASLSCRTTKWSPRVSQGNNAPISNYLPVKAPGFRHSNDAELVRFLDRITGVRLHTQPTTTRGTHRTIRQQQLRGILNQCFGSAGTIAGANMRCRLGEERWSRNPSRLAIIKTNHIHTYLSTCTRTDDHHRHGRPIIGPISVHLQVNRIAREHCKVSGRNARHCK